MKPLNIGEVSRVATEAAMLASSRLRVVGVTRGSGGSDYVEVVLDDLHSQTTAGRVVVGVFRSMRVAELRDEIGRQLSRYLAQPRR